MYTNHNKILGDEEPISEILQGLQIISKNIATILMGVKIPVPGFTSLGIEPRFSASEACAKSLRLLAGAKIKLFT